MLMRASDVRGISSSSNLLLANLAPADSRMLLPHLRRVPFARGTKLLSASERIDTVYFPETGLLAIEEGIGRSHVEVAVVGREGMLGWPALLGCDRHAHDAIAQVEDGSAVCIALEPLLDACRASASLSAAMLNFVQSIMVQMARAIATHLGNPLEQRIARWVLMRHDRIDGDEIAVRHDEIATALNVRRASVTERLHVLEGERLIRCRRGHVVVRDRSRLESFAGDAYGIAEASYRQMIGPFGKTQRA